MRIIAHSDYTALYIIGEIRERREKAQSSRGVRMYVSRVKRLQNQQRTTSSSVNDMGAPETEPPYNIDWGSVSQTEAFYIK